MEMTVELNMLALSTVWLFVLILVTVLFSLGQRSMADLAGSRDGLPPATGMFARGQRAVANHMEALMMLAPFVLIASATGNFDATTAMGAQLFFYSRVAHGLVYFAGVPWLRTLIWFVGIVGTGMVACSVFF